MRRQAVRIHPKRWGRCGKTSGRYIRKGKLIQKGQLFQDDEQGEDAHLDGEHHSKQEIRGKKGLSLKFIPGNAECRQSGKHHAAGGAAAGQEDAVEKVASEVVLFENFDVTVQGKGLGPAKRIVQDICLCFKGI